MSDDVEDCRRVVRVNGRLVCPDEMAAHFADTCDRVALRAKAAYRQNARVISKIARYLSAHQTN